MKTLPLLLAPMLLVACQTTPPSLSDYQRAAADIRAITEAVEIAYPENENVQAVVSTAKALADRIELGDVDAVDLLLALEKPALEILKQRGGSSKEIVLAIAAAKILLNRLRPPG